MEFIINTDLEQSLPKVIDFNFEAQRAWLEERLKHYNNLVVTEDAIKEAKEDRANLNKLKEAMETKRKDIKKEWMQPYMDFEAKEKVLVGMIDKSIYNIDGQLKNFDELRKEAKKKLVETTYNNIVDETLRTIIPLERIFDAKWLNATANIKKIEKELEAIAKRTRADLTAIGTVEDEFAAAVHAKYTETLDVEVALNHRKALISAKEAMKQREEALTEEPVKTAPEVKSEPQTAPCEPQVSEEKLYRLRLEFTLTAVQANQLKQFLAEAGINYMKI